MTRHHVGITYYPHWFRELFQEKEMKLNCFYDEGRDFFFREASYLSLAPSCVRGCELNIITEHQRLGLQ